MAKQGHELFLIVIHRGELETRQFAQGVLMQCWPETGVAQLLEPGPIRCALITL